MKQANGNSYLELRKQTKHFKRICFYLLILNGLLFASIQLLQDLNPYLF